MGYLGDKEKGSRLPMKIYVALSIILGIAYIAVGAIHVRDCPAQRFIPVYLIVMGAAMIITMFLRLLVNKFTTDYMCSPFICYGVYLIPVLFTLAWFIAGNVWVYSLYGKYDGEDQEADNYCNKTEYLFAFWSLNIHYILLGFILLVLCCGYYCSGSFRRSLKEKF